MGSATELLHQLLHFTIFPLLLMVGTSNCVLLPWFTAEYCGGSYLKLVEFFAEKGCYDGFHHIWRLATPRSMLAPTLVLSCLAWAIAWMKLLPGPIEHGPVCRTGHVPEYVDNGLRHYLLTVTCFVAATVLLKQNGYTPTIVYDRFGEFIVFLIGFSVLFCILLYLKGRFRPSPGEHGSSGNLVFDYYWGTELYPRVFGIDVKVLTNCRFGLTVWGLLVLVFWLKSYELYGFVDSIAVSSLIQFAYLFKFFYWEIGYLRTMDICTDRAGYYICWGCLVWVPGFFTSTSLWLVKHPVQMGAVPSIGLLLFGLGSIVVNYWADYQKQIVRETDGRATIWGKKPEIIRARYKLEGGKERTSILLVSGFWGLARHFHYVPELSLGMAWCLASGFSHVMPYGYFLFLAVLLIHRTYRDDAKCSLKYGKYWDEYTKRVPSRMIPYLY